jgi:small subunit ribosomal protein S6
MTLPAITYDLVLLLDTQTEPPVRAKIVADASEAISAQGELVRHDEWGERPLAYPIDHQTVAEYHLLQFHATSTELIATLNRSLRITDGIVRFRINKLEPGTPEAPDMRSERTAPSAPARAEAEPAPADEHAVAPA